MPEKVSIYVESADPLRRLMAKWNIESIELIPEDTFIDHA